MSSQIFEITHDSLAAKIWEKVSAEEKTLIEVKNFITNSAAMYKSRKVLLTKQDLAYIGPYETKLALDDETLEFIKRSQRFYRNQKISAAGIITAIIAALVIGIIVISNANRKAKVAESLAKINEGKEKRNAQIADSIATIANVNALRADSIANVAILQSDSLAKVTYQRDNTVAELSKTLKNLESKKRELDLKNQDLDQANIELTTEKENINKQINETRRTLENTNLLNENPTLALKQALALHDSIKNEELKNQLKKNAFDAFNQVIYTNELNLKTPVTDIAVSFDGKSVLIADGTRAPKVWDIGFKHKEDLMGHLSAVTIVAASPTNSHFVTVENNREVIFWGDDFKYLDTANYSDDIKTIRYINEGKELVIGFKNGKMVVTDLRGKITHHIQDNQVIDLEEVIVAEQPGSVFFTRSSDDKIRKWFKNEDKNIFENKILFENNKFISGIISMAISPNGDLLSLATDKGIYCADLLNNGSLNFHFEIFFPVITKIIFKNDHELIISSANGLAFIYNTDSKAFMKLKGYTDITPITNLIKIPKENRFIAVGADQRLTLWDDNANRSFFYRSQEYKPDKVDNPAFTFDKKESKWVFKAMQGNPIYFKNEPDKVSMSYSGSSNDSIKWIIPNAKNDFISITSRPVVKYNMAFYESAVIRQGKLLLNIINIANTGDGDNNKLRNKLSISSVVISDCKKFILIKCGQVSGKYTYYYIYPTFLGLKGWLENKSL